MIGERRVVAGTGLGSSELPDANSYPSVPGCLISDPARSMVNPGSEGVLLWSGVLLRVMSGIQWTTMGSGIQPGGAPSGIRVISAGAAGPATFRVDFDDFTSLPSRVPRITRLGRVECRSRLARLWWDWACPACWRLESVGVVVGKHERLGCTMQVMNRQANRRQTRW